MKMFSQNVAKFMSALALNIYVIYAAKINSKAFSKNIFLLILKFVEHGH